MARATDFGSEEQPRPDGEGASSRFPSQILFNFLLGVVIHATLHQRSLEEGSPPFVKLIWRCQGYGASELLASEEKARAPEPQSVNRKKPMNNTII